MTFLRSLILVCPAACLLAQTPPPPSAAQAGQPPQQGTPVPVKVEMNPPAKPPVSVPPDRVVLKVGDISVTAAQFDQLIDVLPPQSQAAARGPSRKQFADNVVRVFVLANDAKRRKIDDTPSYKTQLMFTINNLLAGLDYKELGKESKVTEDDVRKYYDAHKSEYEEVAARHILIRVQGSPMPVRPGQKELPEAEALAKAQELRKKIVDGADFAKLAETESDDTGSAANGGSLGTFRHGQMVPSFDQAAFALKVGEISEPVKSQYGYHIIKVESHQSKPFEQTRGEIEQRLQPEQTQKALEDLVKKSDPLMDPEYFGLAKQ